MPSSDRVIRRFNAGGQLLEPRRGFISDKNFEVSLHLKFIKYFVLIINNKMYIYNFFAKSLFSINHIII